MTCVKSIFIAAMLAAPMTAVPISVMAKDVKMSGPEVVDVADISVGLNGLVCDFCSIALNKTFKKQASVIGSYVDLDTKTLSLALANGQAMDNDTVIKLVKKSGYSVTKIARKDGSEFIPASKNSG